MELNSREIMEILPHRYPFLLVDKITELEAGVKAVGIKNVTANEMHFLGHFPGNPIMPGVLILEALAQTGALALLSEEENKGKLVFFGGVKSARFRKQVVPGDVLALHCEIVKRRGSVGIGSAKALVDGVVAAEAELTFAIEK